MSDNSGHIKVGVIGTAGRRDDAGKLSLDKWVLMKTALRRFISAIKNNNPDKSIMLVSGGAAWADHLAVDAFINPTNLVSLSLHFPAPFIYGHFQESAYDRTGSIANYYHKQFSKKLGINSLAQIEQALNSGALHTVSNGFYARNNLVANTDLLVAFTFGTKHSVSIRGNTAWDEPTLAGLKDGGTTHTWKRSTAETKYHVNLNEL